MLLYFSVARTFITSCSIPPEFAFTDYSTARSVFTVAIASTRIGRCTICKRTSNDQQYVPLSVALLISVSLSPMCTANRIKSGCDLDCCNKILFPEIPSDVAFTRFFSLSLFEMDQKKSLPINFSSFCRWFSPYDRKCF